MSNHDGSYILNEVLTLLKDEYVFFEKMDQKTKKEFILKILKIGNDHDCNDGEILEDLERDLEFCYLCRESTNDFDKNTICKKCCDQ